MKIIILGAGITGVTTAYFLGKRGHDVTVIDRGDEPASECSYANGGQISYSHAEPWANMKNVKKAIKWIGKKDAPLLFHFRADPYMWLWIMRFLRNCTNSRICKNTQTMIQLGLYSRDIMHEIQRELSLSFDYSRKGILNLFGNEKDFQSFIRQSEFQKGLGIPYEILTPAQCLDKESTINNITSELAGGIYYPLDENGNINQFVKQLADSCGDNVEFKYNIDILKLNKHGNAISSVTTSEGEMEADCYVMCMGCYSPLLLRKIGINIPIYPMKGYSISVKITDTIKAPEMSITHHDKKIVYSRLGDILRVAGTAEFAGYDDSITKHRIDTLKDSVKKYFPDCGDIDGADEWACLRPSTADGPPIIGECGLHNLVLNTGHGTLGWTQSAGSAKLTADIIEGKKPDIDIKNLSYKRY